MDQRTNSKGGETLDTSKHNLIILTGFLLFLFLCLPTALPANAAGQRLDSGITLEGGGQHDVLVSPLLKKNS